MADTIGDKTFEELNLRIGDDYQRPMSAPTRDYTMEIGGRHGAWDFGADLAPKPFSLPCTLIETDPTTLQTAIDDVTDHLFDATGRPKTMKLVFGESPEKYYMVRFAGNLPINRIIGIGQFTLPLVAFDPFSYYMEKTDDLNWGSEIATFDKTNQYFSDQYTFNIDRPSTIKVNNFGSTISEPVTRITGSFSSLVLSSSVGAFSYGRLSGGMLIVDHKSMTATIDGANKLSEHTNNKFLKIPPGVSNIYIDGSGLSCEIAFSFYAPYS
jgi:predicted phage tail component-like protein